MSAVPAPVPAASSAGKVRRPTGPSGIGMILSLLTRRDSANRLYEAAGRQHPPVAHMRMAGEHVYLVSDPALIVEVFLTRAKEVMKGRGLQAARPLLGNGLLTSEGEFHLRQRRLAQPGFHKQRIAAYAEQMVSEAERHAAGWTDGQQVDIAEEMKSLTFAIVGRTLFGTDLTGDAKQFGDTLDELMRGFSRLSLLGSEKLVRATPQGRHLLGEVRGLDAVVQRIIDEHRADHASGHDREDLLSWFIQASDHGESMTDAQLRDEVMTMVLAGHETTAMALSWTWWLLSTNPAAARQLREELDAVLGSRTPTFEDIVRLPYTHAIVAESIRLYPPAWVMGRRTLVDMQIGEWTVPSGSIVLAVPYAMHRDPKYWHSATSHHPERWLNDAGEFDENAPGVPRGVWIPFGFGNRRCIGEQFAWTEAILVLAALAQKWDPELVPGSSVQELAAVTLRPRGGIPMTLKAR